MRSSNAQILLIVALLTLLLTFTESYAYTSPPKEKVIPVKIALFLNNISAINERQETIETELTLFQQWTDRREAFNVPRAGTRSK